MFLYSYILKTPSTIRNDEASTSLISGCFTLMLISCHRLVFPSGITHKLVTPSFISLMFPPGSTRMPSPSTNWNMKFCG